MRYQDGYSRVGPKTKCSRQIVGLCPQAFSSRRCCFTGYRAARFGRPTANLIMKCMFCRNFVLWQQRVIWRHVCNRQDIWKAEDSEGVCSVRLRLDCCYPT